MSDRVLVIIDDPFELSSVGAALRMHGVEVVAEARKKSTAINLFRSLQPNVLLIDMHKSQEHSVDIAHVIRKEAAGIGVVILVPCADMRLIGEDLAQMPAGTLLVLKDALSNLTALCDVISASRVFEADQKVVWVNGGITLSLKESQALMSSLSDIQIQTLRYAAEGLTNAEIGRLRFVSEKAIEQILSRVAIALNIQPDHRKNMRVQLVNEFHSWIGAPTH
jgi:DNA-binding NarL/FixJ family response regulator